MINKVPNKPYPNIGVSVSIFELGAINRVDQVERPRLCCYRQLLEIVRSKVTRIGRFIADGPSGRVRKPFFPDCPLQDGLAEGCHANIARTPRSTKMGTKIYGCSAGMAHLVREETLCRTIPIKEPPSYTILRRTLIAPPLRIMARKITRLRTNTQKRRWNTRRRLTNAPRKPSRNRRTQPFEIADL